MIPTPAMAFDPEAVVKATREEFEREKHRAAVDTEKARLRIRARLPWWKRLFPFTITITRSN